MRRKNSVFLAISGFLLLLTSLALSAHPGTDSTEQTPGSVVLSHVRVVRLSFVEGTVALRRAGSAEWEKAILNAPIQEGFSLATADRSFAEVEFENGSTVRLGQLTAVDFTQLALTPQGGRINHLTLDQGYATFHVDPEHHDEYSLIAAGVNNVPHGRAEFRTDLNQDHLRVEVFDGHVQASDSSQTEDLGKNHALVRDTDPGASFQVTDKIEKDEWDKWTSARDRQSALAVNETAVGSTVPIAGWDDLDVYGEWSYFPGYGNGWAPYEPLGWSPYSAGAWDWYQGMGYTWISAEPWGWLPFHYGYWNFSPGMGWFWMPGSFAGWRPALVNWYSGPGWIGWTPIGEAGVGDRAPCTLAVTGCLTAMPPNSFANRMPRQPGSPHLLHPTSIAGVSAITSPARPTTLIRASIPALASFAADPSGRANIAPGRAPSGLAASGFTRGPEATPSSILMGKAVSPEALVGHRSTLANVFGGRKPVRVRLGNTIGGRFPVHETSTGIRGTGNRDSSGWASMAGGPQILTRGFSGGSSGRGGFESGGRSAGMARGGGGIVGGVASGASHGGAGSGGSSGGGHR